MPKPNQNVRPPDEPAFRYFWQTSTHDSLQHLYTRTWGKAECGKKGSESRSRSNVSYGAKCGKCRQKEQGL